MKFSSVILAGGASQRMGSDKSWLRVRGQSLLARQVALAQAAGAYDVLISGRPGVDYSSLGCPVVMDLWPGCGPLGGMERGLALANTGLVLVLAVDLPCVDAAVLKDLLAQCTGRTGVVPTCDGQMQPLVAIYPQASHELALRRLQHGQFAACGFAAQCCRRNLVKLWPQDTPQVFTNWNQPEDIAAAGT